jgi:hypothetical protein
MVVAFAHSNAINVTSVKEPLIQTEVLPLFTVVNQPAPECSGIKIKKTLK